MLESFEMAVAIIKSLHMEELAVQEEELLSQLTTTMKTTATTIIHDTIDTDEELEDHSIPIDSQKFPTPMVDNFKRPESLAKPTHELKSWSTEKRRSLRGYYGDDSVSKLAQQLHDTIN